MEFKNNNKNSDQEIKKNIDQQIKKAAERLYKNDWPISPNIDLVELMFIGGKNLSKYTFADKNGNELERDKGIDHFVCSIFSKNNFYLLHKIINEWSISPLKKREKIWKQSFNAHINKQYILSTHTIIIQIEGILNESNNIYEYSNREGLTHLVKDFLEWFKTNINSNLNEFSKILVDSFIENIEFTKNKTYKVKDKSVFYKKLNRHYIAHGNLIDANESLSLKCFLLLDLINFAFEEWKNRI